MMLDYSAPAASGHAAAGRTRRALSRSQVVFTTRALLVVFWGIVGSVILRSFNDSPLRLGVRNSTNVGAFAPEGWAFFTRNPREENLLVYRRAGTSWVRAIPTNADPQYLLGLGRAQRVQEMELTRILQHVPATSWIHTRSTIVPPPSAGMRHPVAVNNTAPHLTLCGEFLLQRQEPVPWAWSKSRRTLMLPTSTVTLDIRCARRTRAPVAQVFR